MEPRTSSLPSEATVKGQLKRMIKDIERVLDRATVIMAMADDELAYEETDPMYTCIECSSTMRYSMVDHIGHGDEYWDVCPLCRCVESLEPL